MMRLFFLFFIAVLSLHALSDRELLKQANFFEKSSIKSNQFRAYNDYKNLYLRALMHENKRMQMSALRGIVATGKRLHIDISSYEDKLKKYKNNQSDRRTTHKKLKHTKRVRVQSINKLKSVHWLNSRIVIRFNKKLKKNQINYFTLYDSKARKYKYIFEFDASMMTKSQRLRKDGVDSIQLSQFKPNRLHLEIVNSEKLKINFKKEYSSLVVKITPLSVKKSSKGMPGYAKASHHRVVVRKKSSNQKHKIIVIDPGHGGKDPGAIGYRKYREKDVVLKIGKYLRSILESRGYKVYMTRDADYFVTLRNRTRFANRKKADLFISIHANAVTGSRANQANGIETYFLDKSRSARAKRVATFENRIAICKMDYYGKKSFLNTLNSHNIIASNKLAIDIQRGVLASLRKHYKYVQDAGVREGPFWVLVGAQMPSVLVETGFITNPQEARRLVNSKYEKRFALGLANGVEHYFLYN